MSDSLEERLVSLRNAMQAAIENKGAIDKQRIREASWKFSGSDYAVINLAHFRDLVNCIKAVLD